MGTVQTSSAAQAFSYQQQKRAAMIVGLVMVGVLFSNADAATTGTQFAAMYNFIYGAATGYLGRGIAIFAGVAGLAVGATQGKAMPAILGVILAIFGTLGPAIINTLFNSATI
jgi:conjugal transfer pilus assembly protein TraA